MGVIPSRVDGKGPRKRSTALAKRQAIFVIAHVMFRGSNGCN
jgi:hypothetical protein